MKRDIPDITYASPDDPKVIAMMIRSIERISGKRKIEKLYLKALDKHLDHNVSFWEAVLAQLRVTVNYDPTQLAKIPRTGPVIFIANHPFGVLDGLIACHLATTTRNNFKILTHRLLCRVEVIDPYMLPVDFDETKEAMMVNINTKKEAAATLRQGGTVVVFPGGGISTTEGFFSKSATDLEWKLFAAKLIQQAKATVIPIYFHGQNSRMFQVVSQVSMTLRLSLIIHELRKQMGKPVDVTIGDPIPYQDLAGIKQRKELLKHLREVIYALPEQTKSNRNKAEIR